MSYKGFDPDFKCRGKQYEEGQVYEEQGGTICSAGLMHYCEEPLTVRTFYVDGETVKADTPYKLEGGELKEVKG